MTDAEIEREIDREDRLAQLYDLAGRYVKAAIARGEAFTGSSKRPRLYIKTDKEQQQ